MAGLGTPIGARNSRNAAALEAAGMGGDIVKTAYDGSTSCSREFNCSAAQDDIGALEAQMKAIAKATEINNDANSTKYIENIPGINAKLAEKVDAMAENGDPKAQELMTDIKAQPDLYQIKIEDNWVTNDAFATTAQQEFAVNAKPVVAP